MNYRDLVENKKVVLVGPSPSIIGTNSGKLIDSYDLVCRLNHALPVPKNLYGDIGKRTDILYSTLKIPKTLSSNINDLIKLKYIVCPYPKSHKSFERHWNKYFKIYGDRIPIDCPYNNIETYERMERLLGARPTIGLSAIIDLLASGVSELYITGITFFYKTTGNQGGYYEEYKDKRDYKGVADEKAAMEYIKRWNVHNASLEQKYFKFLCSIDDRIKYDKALGELI